ncbi:DNA translocase FtsK [Mycobacterium attenuatum]|nr:DNA translocase FtsK [Mycobacterium attenuatum]
MVVDSVPRPQHPHHREPGDRHHPRPTSGPDHCHRVRRCLYGVGLARPTVISRLGDRTGATPLAERVALHPHLGIGVPLHGLTARLGERTLVPTLQSVQIGKTTDALQLRIVTGQCLTDWHKQADGLAAAWRADRITIRSIAPGEVRITLMRGDVLADPVDLPMPTSTAAVDLRAVRIGITENRHWWHVPLLGHHMLIAGATGAGKGSVLWSLIAGIAPEVKTGFVRLCVIDPKGGMERGAGAPMFTVFTHDATDTTVHMLRQLVTVMHARANRLRGHTRLHTPSPSEPLFVVVIDEIAALTSYVTDRKSRTEIEQLLGLLPSRGRAVGISVVAAVQDPAKDTLPVRQLFTVRIGLRLTEASQTTMVLGGCTPWATGATSPANPAATPRR